MGVSGFWIDRTPVTNAAFRRFVKATGYVTVAERVPDAAQYPGALPEMLVAGSVVFTQPPGRVPMDTHYTWWDWMPGANWRHPEGPGSTLTAARSTRWCMWPGRTSRPMPHGPARRSPPRPSGSTPPAAGTTGWPFAWGHELAPRGRMLANYWQGEFPWQNLALDGFERTAPVGSFPQRLWAARHDRQRLGVDGGLVHRAPRDGQSLLRRGRQPAGGEPGGEHRPQRGWADIPRKVLKGGSLACAENYCQRYRPAARMHHPIDTGTNHISFRCVVRPGDEYRPVTRSGGTTMLRQNGPCANGLPIPHVARRAGAP